MSSRDTPLKQLARRHWLTLCVLGTLISATAISRFAPEISSSISVVDWFCRKKSDFFI